MKLMYLHWYYFNLFIHYIQTLKLKILKNTMQAYKPKLGN